MKFSDWQELFNHLFQTKKETIEHGVVHDLHNLTTEIVRLKSLAEETDPVSSKAATQNLNAAEWHYENALNFYKRDSSQAALDEIKAAQIRLFMAEEQLSCEYSVEPEINNNELTKNLLALIESVAKTKNAIEYNNCVLTESQKSDLTKIASLVKKALHYLKNKQEKTAENIADGAHLALHSVVLNANLVNRDQIPLPQSQRFFNQIQAEETKSLNESINECRKRFCVPGVSLPVTALRRLAEADNSCKIAIDQLIAGKYSSVDKSVSIAKLDVQFASGLIKVRTGQSHDQDSSELQSLIADSIEFHAICGRLTEFIEYLKSFDHSKQSIEFLDRALHDFGCAVESVLAQDLAQARSFTDSSKTNLENALDLFDFMT